jgi:polyisoprenoid-binding protein YceI
MKSKVLACVWIISCIYPVFANADYSFLKDKSTLSFTASTWLFSATGTFSDWNISDVTTGAKPTDIRFTVTINMSMFDTKNSTRDAHLKTADFFWVEKFSSATFKVVNIAQKDGDLFSVTGDFTLRGITKSIAFDAKLEQKDGKYHVSGDAFVNRQDFGIAYKSYMFPIQDKVTVHFDVQGIETKK